ncbi:MAG TPA: bifunctional diaminohydroxyphosphoribosylaminopyrimidine deaminase/5-amino-6-(5-phosphoribosylamino)uracil reductase RibD [Rhizomicrobium sp.]
MEPFDHARHMRHALGLAARALGQSGPNPSVGCVIVSAEGVIAGRGWTGRGGRPHAETAALVEAGGAARGATAYVTLEPCAHHGETPPCADALVQAGVARVVASIEDPDSRVNGRGLGQLRAAGVEVVTGVLCDAAAELNAGFFLRVREQRPLVTLKIAASADGRIAGVAGDSRWITGEDARRFGHLLRASHDAILIGVETAIADDPLLTCRVAGIGPNSPLRVVLDSRLRLSPESKLAKTAATVPTLAFTITEGGAELRARGVEIATVARDARGRPDVAAVLRALAARKINRLLVEGGAGVHASFLDRGLADCLELFRAPLVLGAAGHPAVDALAALSLDEAPRFVRAGVRRLGSDLLESFRATH